MDLPVLYPMGAVTVSDDKLESLWNDPLYVAERKYDGSRYLIRKENGTIRIVSRQKSKKTGLPVDKTENVPHLKGIFMKLPNGTVLDGEIITDENCTSNEVTSIMGSLPDVAIQKQKERGWVKYVMYDVLFFNGQNIMERPYIFRRKALERIYHLFFSDPYSEFYNPEHTDYVLLAPVYTEGKENFYKEIVNGGGEGVILKNIQSVYVPEKKPRDTWVKVKKYNTYDVVIMGFTAPTKEYTGKELELWPYWVDPYGGMHLKQNESAEFLKSAGFTPVTKPYFYGWCGAVKFGQYKDGKLIEVGQTSGLDDATKEMFALNPDKYIGTVIEVGAMEQIKKTGALRHPRFIRIREDKSPEQCILGEV